MIKWNNLQHSLRNAHSFSNFKQNIITFTCLGPIRYTTSITQSGLKSLTSLSVGLSHLRAHKFSHNFSECLDELFITGTNIKSKNHFHFLLQCLLYLSERETFMEKVLDVEFSVLDQNENCLCYTLPFGIDKLNDVKNLCILRNN